MKGRASRRQSKMLYRTKKFIHCKRVYYAYRLKSISIVRHMHDYAEFPPIDSFKKVLRTSPQSALIYASIWKLKPDTNHLAIKKIDIKKTFLISPTLFRNHLLSLGRLELLSFEETTVFFLVDFYEIERN